mmetsp:Transcript_105441/g.251121  ORF Transcript_105441/g.251121 Transcript_105441/m.251121 type:complete len:213 (-) Transcript_105441:411-1049(-)
MTSRRSALLAASVLLQQKECRRACRTGTEVARLVPTKPSGVQSSRGLVSIPPPCLINRILSRTSSQGTENGSPPPASSDLTCQSKRQFSDWKMSSELGARYSTKRSFSTCNTFSSLTLKMLHPSSLASSSRSFHRLRLVAVSVMIAISKIHQLLSKMLACSSRNRAVASDLPNALKTGEFSKSKTWAGALSSRANIPIHMLSRIVMPWSSAR